MDKLFVKEEGSGPPLLLLHGFLEDHHVWDAVAPRLAEHFHLIMPDLPGHGRSGDIVDRGGMQDMAEMVRPLIDRENHAFPVVGHSMGGYVALELMRRDSRTSNVILAFSTTEPDSDSRKVERERAAEVYRRSPSMFCREAIPNLFAPSHRSRLKAQIERLTQIGASHPVEGVLSALSGMKNRRGHTRWIIDNRKKILFLSGRQDTVVPPEKIKAIAAQSELIDLEVFEHSGHMGMIEEPDKFVQVIINKLAGYS